MAGGRRLSELWLPEGWDWRAPQYSPVYLRRLEAINRMRDDPASVPPLLEYYSTHWAQFVHDWGFTSDPRNAERGLPVKVPFLLFPK